MYLSLNNNRNLYLYKKHGLLKNSNDSTIISKDIANVLCYCHNGYSLYEAICAVDCNKFYALLGIAKLITENKISTATVSSKNNSFEIIDESHIHYPESLHIELTKKCNLKCYYCYNESAPHVNETALSSEQIFLLLSELSEKGLTVVEITGGEPLLHPDFFKIVDYCYNHLQLFSILTNGTLINEAFVEKIMPYKSKIVFSISLDSYNKADYEYKSQVPGSFEKVSRAIELLSKSGFIVRASMSIDDKNWDQIEKTLLYAKSLGATKFTYSPIIPVGRAANSKNNWNNVNPKDVFEYEQFIVNKYSDYVQLLDNQSIKELSQEGGCGAGSRTFVMNPQGIVRMCATFTEDGIIGDLSKQTIQEVFSNPLCNLSSTLVLPNEKTCKDCVHLAYCTGCSLRTLMKINDIGKDNCLWIQNPNSQKWYKMMCGK